MKSLEESVVMAMDGSDVALFPFLSYILQDLWEIGASPKVIIGLVRKHTKNYSNLSVLDLGCGKGAVSVKLAKEFNCKCFGIDAVKEFIDEANEKAGEFGVDHLCRFAVADIRERIKTLKRFDIIILGAIGPVFGDYFSTLTIMSKCLTENGIIIIDDGYIENESEYVHPLIKKQEIILRQIGESGMRIIDQVIIKANEIKDADEQIFANLKKRCQELIEKHPQQRELFENYIRDQEQANDVLETKVICSTMAIGKK